MVKYSLLEEAKSHVGRGEIDQAIQKFSEHLNSDFFDEETLFMLGACLHAKGMNGLSAVLTSAAIDARATRGKQFPEALLNLGSAYKAEHRNDMALKMWQDALKQETIPRERSKIYSNMSGLHVNEGDPEPAVKYCDLALAEDPNNLGAQFNRGLACLELGRWREGWDGYDRGFETEDRTKRLYRGVPEWRGEPGKTVIVWGEQGVGDEIYFASCIPDLIKVCKQVIFDCHPRLDVLFQRSFPTAKVYGTRKTLTEIAWVGDCGAEASVCLSDLPRFFRSEAKDWPGTPYLTPTPFNGQRSGKLRIGLSWAGGAKKTRAELRSIPLDAFADLVRANGDADWFSLQYTDNAASEVCAFEENTGVHIAHFPGLVECRDYDKTVSFISSLDLVITVCTTAHHAAASIGVPTWTLVPSKPSWRYQLKGATLPWYGSARVFRQLKGEDWTRPIANIGKALADFRRLPRVKRYAS